MNLTLGRRLAALEAAHPIGTGRRSTFMPWDRVPAEGEGDMFVLYNLVAVTPDGPTRTEYERNGIHPRDDAPGSWNRHLYFGEPHNA